MNAHPQVRAALTPLRGGRLFVPLLVIALLVPLSVFSFPLFHLLAELIPIIIATSAFTIAWSTYPFSRNSFLLFLATGLFCLGLLDLFHSLAYKGMEFYPGVADSNRQTQFWIGAHYLQALLLLIAPLTTNLALKRVPLLLAMGGCTLLVFAWIMSGHFPDAFIEGQGLTSFKIYSEYLIVALLAASLIQLHRRRADLGADLVTLVQVAVFVTILSELSFTFYVSVDGLSNLVGHLLKIIAYWYIYSVFMDFAIRARAESEDRFRSVFDQQFQFMAILTPEGRVIDINELVRRFQGYAREDFIGRLFWESPAWRDYPEWREIWPKRLAQATTMDGPLITHDIYQKRNGEIRMADAATTAIRGPDGAVRWYVIQATDTTERRRAEAALRESEERLRMLLRRIPDLVWLKDPDGRYLTCNARFETLFGRPEAEIIGKTDYDFVDRAQADFFRANDLAAIAAGGPRVNEEEIVFAGDGHRERIQVVKTPVHDADGTVIGVLGIARDITEMRRVEQELEQHRHHLEELVAERTEELTQARLEAERLAQSKGEFLANMSHEIRTPMNAVLGLAYLLERQPLPDEARELARQIHRSGQSLLRILNDILDFSKIESGRIEIERIPFQLGELLDNLVTIVGTSAADKAIDLVIRPPEDLESSLVGDPLRLGQILINLTSNAIKFTSVGQVAVRVESIARSHTEVTLRFTVRDTGIGIDPETQARLFQPFTQADASTTRRFGGSGLGLVICRRLAELMGGRLGLDSVPGEGSTFWLELTFGLTEHESRPGTSSLDASPDSGESPLSGLRVLVVDDSEINREVAHLIFSGEGAEVCSLNDGRQAVDWLIAHPMAVDIVLMDVHMPVMDGRAATRLIRETPEIAWIPIVALTADAVGDQEGAALEAGMDAFLPKPLDVPAAVALIRRLTGRAVEIPEDRHTPDPAAGSVQVHPSDSELEFPGLDVERALTVWKDADVYGQYLRHFVDSYGEVSRRLVTAEPESARQLAHKLRGAAGNLGLVDVAARAAELEQALKSAGTRTTPEIDSQVVALQGALATALASIERFATVPSSVPTGLRHHIGSRANPGR